MGIAMLGLTHCEKCRKTLNYDEYVLCKSCEKEKEEEEEEKKSKIETCGYCSAQKYLAHPSFYSVHIQQFEDKNKKKIYMLAINSNVYIPINYCPICGRKLSD